jgi:hypothetical protein
MRKFWFSFFFIFSLVDFVGNPLLGDPTISEAVSYPNFQDNPYLNDQMRKEMAPYLLPLDHPLKGMLDAIFSESRVTENKQTLLDAGFTIIAAMEGSFVTVARHPQVPGYVFKLYLDSEMRCKNGMPNCLWLTQRCVGAQKIRNFIKRKKFRYFAVPDKWLYVLPLYPSSKETHPQPVLVIETDMELVGKEGTKHAWKKAKRKHLDELYFILIRGYGTTHLIANIPYTKRGKFAFTDTEYPKRRHDLRKIKIYLSKDMQLYWDSLIR